MRKDEAESSKELIGSDEEEAAAKEEKDKEELQK